MSSSFWSKQAALPMQKKIIKEKEPALIKKQSNVRRWQ